MGMVRKKGGILMMEKIMLEVKANVSSAKEAKELLKELEVLKHTCFVDVKLQIDTTFHSLEVPK